MAGASSIEWTDATWNPVRGCVKVSPGCKYCYAETFAERFRGVPGHPYEQGFDPRLVATSLDAPLHWRKPRKIFVNSMSDMFGAFVPNDYIAAVFGVMAACRQHTFQVLTKRAERLPKWFDWIVPNERDTLFSHAFEKTGEGIGNMLALQGLPHGANWRWPLPNVHLGVSVEDRKYGLPRIEHLLQTPAAVRFLSIEPLLEDLGTIDLTGIHWVIVGGESGKGARPMHPDWARSIRDQCVAAGVPFFFKQWGEWWPCERGDNREFSRDLPAMNGGPNEVRMLGDVAMLRIGKKNAGRVLDGRTWNEVPR
jgi:protein gp37